MAYSGFNIDVLHRYIEKIASQVVSLNGSNTISMGTIEESLAGYYNVKLTNGDTSATVAALSINDNTYKVDDYVYLVKAENGGTTTKYFIVGLVSDIQEDFVNLTDLERFNPSASIKEVNKFYYSRNLLIKEINDKVFLDAIKEQGFIKISGEFNCPGADGKKVKNYGIQIDLYAENANPISTYYLDTHYFTGQPFNTLQSFQQRLIKLDKINSLKKITIKLYKDQLEDLSDNFWVQNIVIAAGALKEVTQKLFVKVEAQNNKNYFYKEGSITGEDIVTLVATPYVDKQALSASSIQYYWLIKDATITKDSDKYLHFVGEGWRCLNISHKVDAIGVVDKVQVWENKSNSISFSKDKEEDMNYFSNYLSQLKCAIKYQNVVAISDEFEILNYNRESFYAKIESNVEPKLLILDTDKVELSCQVEDENELTNINDYTFQYQWQKKIGENYEPLDKYKTETENPTTGETEIIYTFEKDDFHLIVKDDEKESTEHQYEMAKGEGAVKFRCVVQVYKGSSFVTTIYSESVEVTSKVAVAAQLSQPTYYKYFIDTDLYLTFQKEEDDKNNNWTGDWLVYKKTADETEESGWKWNKYSVNWTTLSEIDNAAFDVLNKKEVNDNECLYYTYQKVWKEVKEGEDSKVLKTENWAEPTRLKIKVGSVEISPQAVAKMNTFNNLTQGGELQGLQTTPDGDVYLNATYINTGTLIVSDTSADKEPVFMADIDTGEVKIAGFTVDEDSVDHIKTDYFKVNEDAGYNKDIIYYIKNNNNEYQKVEVTEENFLNQRNNLYINKIIEKVHLGTDGLNIGDKLTAIYDQNGDLQVSVTGSITIMDGDEEKELTEVINTIKSRKVQTVYSSSINKPTEPPKYETIVEGEIWHTGLTEKDIWMCQKVDTTLEDTSTPWGEIILVKGLSVSAVDEYYAISKSNTTSPNKNNLNPTGIEGWRDTLINPNKEYPYLWNYEVSYYDESKTLKAFENDPTIILHYTEDGRGIVSITNYYQTTSSSTAPARWEGDTNKADVSTDESKTIGTLWKTSADPTTNDNKYLWNFEKIEYSKSSKYTYTAPIQIGAHGNPGTPGGIGPTGNGIETQTEYYKANGNTAPDIEDIIEGEVIPGTAGSGWYTKENFFKSGGPWDTKAEVSANPYVWKIIYTTYTNGNKTVTDPVLLSDLDAATNAAAAQISENTDIGVGKTYASVVGKWCALMDRTLIDGGTIITGSIGADQIKANSITAGQIDVGSLTAHNDFKVSIQKSIDAIDIGGRNLIFNSRGNSLDGWICNIGRYFGQIVTDSEKKSCIEISNTTESELFIATPRTAVLENYENYTFSCDIWVGNYTKSVDFYFMSDTEDDQQTQAGYVNFNCFKSGYIPTVREKWHRFTQTFKMVDNAYTGYIRIDNNGTTTTENTAIVKIANIKLERGNKATDWTPAPEDMATSAELKVTRDSISSKVESSVYESGLTQLADQMVAKVHNKESGDVCSWSMAPAGFNVSAVADGVGGGITVDKNGLTVDGTVKAQKGKIGGYTLENEILYAGNEVGYVGLDARCDLEEKMYDDLRKYKEFKYPYAFYAGSENPDVAPFRVTKQGVLTSEMGNFSGKISSRVGSIGPIKFNNNSFNALSISVSIKSDEYDGIKIFVDAKADSELKLNTPVQANCNRWDSNTGWTIKYNDPTIRTGTYPAVLSRFSTYTPNSSSKPTKIIYTKPNIIFTVDKVQSDDFSYNMQNGQWAEAEIDSDFNFIYNGETTNNINISPGGVIYFLNTQGAIMSIYHIPSGHDFFGSTKDNLFTVKSDYRYAGSINCGNKSTASDYSQPSTNNPAEGFYLDKNYLFMSGSTQGTSINVKGDIKCNQVNTNGITLQSTRGQSSITYDGTNVNIDQIKSRSIVDASGYNVFRRKFYFWEYSSSVTESAPQSITISSTTHKLSAVKGAIVTPRTDSDNMGNWNNIVANDTQIGVYISGTTVKICVDNGELKDGFYCLIYGE